MNQELKRKVLTCFKQLHRTRLTVFQGDTNALAAAREQINGEFTKNINVSNSDSIEELITFGQQVEEVLRTSVIQAVKREDGTYSARILEDTLRLDNKPYQPMPENMIGPFKKKKTKCSK
ncbi:complex III assembly factor LYRM7-like [Homarus americanus]|uniref:complex III assembly factor LYRM7-like n=1 Tax=Homarus americanus TaxID=6706 RepID=UPI001C48BD8E|nr:complex III assembly factor LYRM7-like [Homarus americanus]